MSSVAGHPANANVPWLPIVDRYLLRQFIQTFLICFCSLTGLYVVIDGFANLEEFVTYAEKKGTLLSVMGEYYAYRSLSFFDTTSHILTLISAMFTVTWIQRHNEMTALEAAGIPKARIVKPVIVAAIVVILLSVFNREWLIPSVRQQLSFNAQDLGNSAAKQLQPRFDNETDVWLGGAASKMIAAEQRIQQPEFSLPATLGRYGSRVAAEDAFYQPPHDGQPGGFLFRNVEQPQDLDNKPSLSIGDRAIFLTPRDTPWLKPGECFVVTNVSFEHLLGGGARQFASTAELIEGLKNRSLDFGAGERSVIHARIVQPVLDLTLLFLGLPLVLSRSNRNVFVAIGLCLVLVLAFMLVVMGCKYLGSSYWLEPSLAAWLPLMIFVPCAVALAQPFRE